jgi:hypothetical protein
MLKSALRPSILRALVVVVAMVSACTGAERRTPYTESELQTAVPMGIPAVRTWADAPLSVLRPQVAHLPIFNGSGEFSILALSGGGGHGAFGAGLLNGWSQSGQRPTFSIVTGISTGAPMAPFAFKEMHVDGGTSLQILAIPLKLAAAGRLLAADRPPGQLYISLTISWNRRLR